MSKRNSALVRIAAALALAALPSLSLAQWWNPAYNNLPESARRPIEYGPVITFLAERAIANALAAGDYAKLDRMHDEFLEFHRSSGPGRGLIDAFPPAFETAYADPSKRDTFEKLFAAWRQAAPDSRLRPTAEAAFRIELAWEARGSGYSSSVTPEGRKAFNDYLTKAAKALDEGSAKGRESPLWFDRALGVAGSLGAPRQALDQIFDEGAKRFPAFRPLYRTRVNFLLPQWGGDYPNIERFIRAAVMRSQQTEGTTFYADLYMKVLEYFRGEDFFRETSASWPVMRHAFEEKVALGIADLDRYATLACMAGDRETTARLLAQLGHRANLGRGVRGFSTETCTELVRERH